MSDNETLDSGTVSDNLVDANVTEKRDSKKNSIPADEINTLVEGLPQYNKTSFLVVGHKNGVRLAIPKTSGVSRTYFYANDDYSIIPDDEAITVFDEADRKEHRRGGIMAEVNYDKGLEAARRALGKLIDAVKAAPVPVVKVSRVPRVKKEPKVAVDDTAGAADDGQSDGADTVQV